MEVEEFWVDSWLRSIYDEAARAAWIDFQAHRPGIPLTTFEDEKPGTPLAEHFNEIAAKLKEIEAERQKECQAAEIPEEKN